MVVSTSSIAIEHHLDTDTIEKAHKTRRHSHDQSNHMLINEVKYKFQKCKIPPQSENYSQNQT